MPTPRKTAGEHSDFARSQALTNRITAGAAVLSVVVAGVALWMSSRGPAESLTLKLGQAGGEYTTKLEDTPYREKYGEPGSICLRWLLKVVNTSQHPTTVTSFDVFLQRSTSGWESAIFKLLDDHGADVDFPIILQGSERRNMTIVITHPILPGIYELLKKRFPFYKETPVSQIADFLREARQDILGDQISLLGTSDHQLLWVAERTFESQRVKVVLNTLSQKSFVAESDKKFVDGERSLRFMNATGEPIEIIVERDEANKTMSFYIKDPPK